MDINTRNRIFMENQDLILRTMKRNRLLLRAMGLEWDDVYQDLAIAVLNAIDSFDPQRSDNIQAHIWMKLQYAILDMKRQDRPHGLTGTGSVKPQCWSVELREELGFPLSAPAHEEFEDIRNHRLRQAMSRLQPQERAVIILFMDGVKPRKKAEITQLETVLGKLRDLYLTIQPLVGGAV